MRAATIYYATKQNEMRTAMGGLQWCTGLVPRTRETKLLGTNPCALETPTLTESAEDDNKNNASDRGCERLEQANKQTINRAKNRPIGW